MGGKNLGVSEDVYAIRFSVSFCLVGEEGQNEYFGWQRGREEEK
jgi:hypothetical protein